MSKEIIWKLKSLIEEYEELSDELDEMSNSWENGTPEDAAMADPSDQYMKGMEIEEKYKEIKETLKEM